MSTRRAPLALPHGQPEPAGRPAPVPRGPFVCVVGAAGEERWVNSRPFPPQARRLDERAAHHVTRVARRLDRAMADGATHLIVPRDHAGWLGDHPHLADHLATRHDLVAASADDGIVFELRPAAPIIFHAEVSGWQPVVGEGIRLRADTPLDRPMVSLAPLEPARGLLRGRIGILAEQVPTLRVEFVLTRPDRQRAHHRRLYLSLARPGWLMHDLPFAQATFEGGAAHLEFDLRLDRGRALERIVLSPVEEDNWRLHPMYPGGASFALPEVAPAGATLTLQDVAMEPVTSVRRGPPHGTVRAARPAPYRKPAGRPRDAVLFSSWVPEDGLALGDYFIATLRRWHGDSKIFVGINHGSSPRWRARLEASGLDVTIQDAAANQTIACDPTGFVAALDAFRRHEERFALVWFGHTKGLGHLREPWYGTGRWTIERVFWCRRQAIEQHFTDPRIGLYAPHYLMLLPIHRSQTDALQRIFRGPCAPLGAMAVATHYVMRGNSVREFCATVDPRFFRDGPAPFGGDNFFFEMAMPNVPLMQGLEPFIEPGLGGTSGPPRPASTFSVLNDWRHNNAVVAQALELWRRDPELYRLAHNEYREIR